MSKVFFDISMSLDGFIAVPNAGPEQGLGEGAEPLHAWMLADNIDPAKVAIECTRVIHSPAVTHLRYRVVQ
jgi:hypothetical protein